MPKQKQWHQKEFHLEKWLHKQFYFRNETEYAIFLVWALLVAVFFSNLT
jgi:hypothetical protein